MFYNLNKIAYFVIFLAIFLFIFKIFFKILPFLLICVVILFFPYQKLLLKVSNLLKNVLGLSLKKENYEVNAGKIYKQCGYCKKRADRKALQCDFCGRPFE